MQGLKNWGAPGEVIFLPTRNASQFLARVAFGRPNLAGVSVECFPNVVRSASERSTKMLREISASTR
jgi:hypothetical protein